MKERQLVLSAEVLSINENPHPDYINLELVVISNKRNLNGIKFTESFMERAVNTIVGMPLQVDKKELERGNYDSLTHKYDGMALNTDSIGTFTNSSIEEIDDVKVIVAVARVWKRYPKTIEAIMELHNAGLLRASVEATVTDFEDISETEYDAFDGRIFAHTIVSNPAETRASSRLLVAEAFNHDLEQIEEERQMDKELQTLQEKVEKLTGEITSLNEKLNKESEEKADLTKAISEKEGKINEMAEEIIQLSEKLKSEEETYLEAEKELASVKEELSTYKEAELEVKRTELKAVAEKHLGEELSEEVLTAIAELREKDVKVAIAEALMAKETETITSEDVVIASEEEKVNNDNIFEL